jgi:hypothetical protein
MVKSYTDELAEWVKKRESKGRDKNLVAFHGVRDDVKAAIEAGYSAKTVWSNMHETGRVGFGYETFLSYVHRLIKKPRDAKPGIQSGESIVAAGVKSPDREPTSTQAASPIPPTPANLSTKPATPAKRAGMPTFKFNPVSPKNREETE